MNNENPWLQNLFGPQKKTYSYSTMNAPKNGIYDKSQYERFNQQLGWNPATKNQLIISGLNYDFYKPLVNTNLNKPFDKNSQQEVSMTDTTKKSNKDAIAQYVKTGTEAINSFSKMKWYKKGGFWGTIKDIGLAIGDTALGTVGMHDVISDRAYDTDTMRNIGNIGSRVGQFGTQIGATIIGGPTAGAAVSAGQNAMQSTFNNNLVEQQNAITQQNERNNTMNYGRETPLPFKLGGQYNIQGDNFTEFHGNKHEEGGIPLGKGAEVEGGEAKYNLEDGSSYIFSDYLGYKSTSNNKKAKGKTFAKEAIEINDRFNIRPYDSMSERASNRALAMLTNEQELVKTALDSKDLKKQQKKMFRLGGGEGNSNADREINPGLLGEGIGKLRSSAGKVNVFKGIPYLGQLLDIGKNLQDGDKLGVATSTIGLIPSPYAQAVSLADDVWSFVHPSSRENWKNSFKYVEPRFEREIQEPRNKFLLGGLDDPKLKLGEDQKASMTPMAGTIYEKDGKYYNGDIEITDPDAIKSVVALGGIKPYPTGVQQPIVSAVTKTPSTTKSGSVASGAVSETPSTTKSGSVASGAVSETPIGKKNDQVSLLLDGIVNGSQGKSFVGDPIQTSINPWAYAPGYVSDYYNLYRGLKGPDPVQKYMYNPEYVNTRAQEVLLENAANNTYGTVRANLPRSSQAAYLASIGSAYSGIADNLGKQQAQVRQQRDLQNNQLANQAQTINMQSQMQADQTRQQELDAARSWTSQGLASLANRSSQWMADKNANDTQNFMLKNILASKDFQFTDKGIEQSVDSSVKQYMAQGYTYDEAKQKANQDILARVKEKLDYANSLTGTNAGMNASLAKAATGVESETKPK